jgi:hypothetical protein
VSPSPCTYAKTSINKVQKTTKKKSKHDFLITFWQSDIIVQLLSSPLFHINIINKNTYKPLPRCPSLSLCNCILNGEHIIIHIFPNDIQQLTPILSFKVASIQTYDWSITILNIFLHASNHIYIFWKQGLSICTYALLLVFDLNIASQYFLTWRYYPK